MAAELDKIIDLIKELRGTSQPCHWTKAQTFSSLKHQTIEEAYELLDAIEENDDQAILDELGDLLYHVIFYIQIAQELSLFTFNEVVQSILDKHHRRLPSPEERQTLTKDQLEQFWEQAKKSEDRQQTKDLKDKVKYLPALLGAQKLVTATVQDKDLSEKNIISDIQKQLLQALQNQKQKSDPNAIRLKMGKLLFACVELAQYLEVDPEEALRIANKNYAEKIKSDKENLGHKK
jgi:nucleoside triphosphate diphosphatase